MLDKSASLNKIYGTRPQQTLSNRIKFIDNRSSQFPLFLDSKIKINDNHLNARQTTHVLRESAFNNTFKNNYISLHSFTQAREHSYGRQLGSPIEEHLREIRRQKLKNYQERKQNSRLLKKKIVFERQRQRQRKSLQRLQIIRERQQARQKLSQYQNSKLKSIRQQRERQKIQEQCSQKAFQLRSKMLLMENASLTNYQQHLAYKKEIIRKIKATIGRQNKSSGQ